MQLYYFVLDADGQFHRAERAVIEALWNGRTRSDELGCRIDDRLRLITVLCDRELLPLVCYFVNLSLENGAITDDSKIQAYEAMTSRHRRRYDHATARRQLAGWPRDWQYQLAVALDVPAKSLQRIGIGGPLVMSDLWGIPIEQVLEYFEQAIDEQPP